MSAGLIHILAAVGAIVVGLALLAVAYVSFGLLLLAVERLLTSLSKWVFHIGGGSEGETPRRPFDRLWIEFNWLCSWTRWFIRELGYSSWNNTSKPGRPDIEKLHEQRRDSGGASDAE